MASKRKQTADLLNKPTAIDAQFQNAQSAPQAEKFKRKTYLLTDELIDRMAALAAAHRVGVNDMARHLIGHVLTWAESGQVEIKTEVIDAVDRPGYTKTVIVP